MNSVKTLAPRLLRVVPAVGLALPLLVAAPATAEPGDDPLRINEILADPASDWDGDGEANFKDDEWVEIVNAGSVPVALEPYRLSGAEQELRFGFTGTLAPGGVVVVYGSESTAWEAANGESQFGLRLNNTGGYLALWRIDGPDTVLVDCYTYLDHEAEDDRSTGRAPDGADAWRVFDGMNPYDGETAPLGTGCAPTPGEGVSCPTPVEASTWGRLKRGGFRP